MVYICALHRSDRMHYQPKPKNMIVAVIPIIVKGKESQSGSTIRRQTGMLCFVHFTHSQT